jgi:hypothetical protein
VSSVAELVKDRFEIGFVYPDGRIVREADHSLYTPDEGEVVTILCPRCKEPAWAVTRHCVERHGDTDVEILPPHPSAERPEWFQPDWI